MELIKITWQQIRVPLLFRRFFFRINFLLKEYRAVKNLDSSIELFF